MQQVTATARMDDVFLPVTGGPEAPAPRERIYEALVNSDQVGVWAGYPIGIEPWVGGRFAMPRQGFRSESLHDW